MCILVRSIYFTAYRYINLRRLTHRRPMRIPYLNHVLIWSYSRSLYTLETPGTQASNENLLFKSCDLYSLLLLVELLYRPVRRYQPSLSLQVWFERGHSPLLCQTVNTSKNLLLILGAGFHINWFSSDTWAVCTCWQILVARDIWRKMAASVEPGGSGGGKAFTRGLSDKRWVFTFLPTCGRLFCGAVHYIFI